MQKSRFLKILCVSMMVCPDVSASLPKLASSHTVVFDKSSNSVIMSENGKVIIRRSLSQIDLKGEGGSSLMIFAISWNKLDLVK
ncbi:MAG: hypothetical protein K5780_05980 [Alphaproteobacteria bacterium]|nr:hypothetical protein [Alphaproteobacteria bacterium]